VEREPGTRRFSCASVATNRAAGVPSGRICHKARAAPRRDNSMGRMGSRATVRGLPPIHTRNDGPPSMFRGPAFPRGNAVLDRVEDRVIGPSGVLSADAGQNLTTLAKSRRLSAGLPRPHLVRAEADEGHARDDGRIAGHIYGAEEPNFSN